MIDLDMLRRAEIGFCDGFATHESRPYGVLYHNVDNPTSHDSNHAVITDQDADPTAALADIVSFYGGLGLTPRVYCSLHEGELARLRPALAAQGFTVLSGEALAARWYVWQDCRPASVDASLAVRRVREIGPAIERLIDSDGECPWGREVLRRHVRLADFHLLVAYLGEVPVAMASFKVMDGLSRVDDVLTDPAYRGRGYARALMSGLAARHREASANALYLSATNPVAMRVYEAVGFVEQPVRFDYWTAARDGTA